MLGPPGPGLGFMGARGMLEGSVRVLPLGVVYTYRNDKVFMLQHSQELSGSGFRCRILGVYGLGF